MDYVVGSVAALIAGNVTPNRPHLIRRARTPTKHPASPNVTPKSEFLDDRSILLSPTLQKKKAIVKKSPKRIFESTDLDTTEKNETSSPKADKVKKHLKGELEAEELGKTSIVSSKSPSHKLERSLEPVSPNNKTKIIDSQHSNENTRKKKKRKSETGLKLNPESEEMLIDKKETGSVNKKQKKSPTKAVKRDNSVTYFKNCEDSLPDKLTVAADNPDTSANDVIIDNQEGKKQKNKKRKKNSQGNCTIVENNLNKENLTEVEKKNPKKKNNRKKKAKREPKNATEVKEDLTPSQSNNDDEDQSHDESEDEIENPFGFFGRSDSDSETEISNVANPNAITEKDSDSEHDSDDDIDSENEEINKEAFKIDEAEDTSDDEGKPKKKEGKKNIEVKKKQQKEEENEKETQDGQEIEANTEEEIKRTLFVGNVPFSDKCKKEIKKIFSQYGIIETVRIRTVPVKDGRVTPKLAVIRNEIHPDRSTVNVYVKFAEPDSVERALVENNTVLNKHHLRVSRSDATGVEHDPNLAVFVGNLPFGIEDETLRAKFDKCGEIESVRIVRDKKTNAGKGFGYINFTSKDAVELALSLSEEDLTIKNRIIRVKRCTDTLSKGPKKNLGNEVINKGPKKHFGNNQGHNRNFGNNQGQNRNFGNNQGQNRNFGNNQGQDRNFGNNQGQNRNFGNNQGQNRNFGNQRREMGNNQGQNRNFGNQGHNRNFGNNSGPRNFGNQNNFGNQGAMASGASRRLMNKRPNQESGYDGPPNKKQHLNQPREKKQRKEFIGMTAEKKKKQKFDKGQKKKKAISEIMTKKM